MTIVTLKQNIEKHLLSDELLIFKWKDTNFIPKQYLNEILKIRNLRANYVETLEECYSPTDDFFGEVEPIFLNVLVVENLVFPNIELRNIKNTIVICHSIEPKEDVSLDLYLIEFPELVSWQINDYMRMKCPGMQEDAIDFLENIAKDDIYRIDNELSKISIFPKEQQDDMFNQIGCEEGYSDMNPNTIFNFTNALLKRDFNALSNILMNIENIDIEGVGLITILHKNLRDVINIQLNPKASPESLNMTPKQFNAIKYSCGKMTSQQLMKAFKFITSLDCELKSGNLPFTNARLIDYIMCNIL